MPDYTYELEAINHAKLVGDHIHALIDSGKYDFHYFTKEHYRKPFNEIPHSTIDARLSIFTAVRGCNSDQAAQLNQPHIVEYIVECLINEEIDRSFITKSFFGSYEKSPYFGKVYRVTKK